MEIASIITSEIAVVSLFDTFIYSFPFIQLLRKDHDTAFFSNVINKKDKLYYHFKLDDVDQEFLVNYTEQEINQIKKEFGEKPIYMFDLSYTTEDLLSKTIEEFKNYLMIHDESLVPHVLLSHPFEQLKKL